MSVYVSIYAYLFTFQNGAALIYAHIELVREMITQCGWLVTEMPLRGMEGVWQLQNTEEKITFHAQRKRRLEGLLIVKKLCSV